jgi:hypothetical protein
MALRLSRDARAWVVLAQVLLAESLLSGEGDVILGLQSLSGAVGMTAFTYFLPFLCHGAFTWDELQVRATVCRATSSPATPGTRPLHGSGTHRGDSNGTNTCG